MNAVYELQQRRNSPPEMYLRAFGAWVVLTVLPSRDEAERALRNYEVAFPDDQFRVCRNSSGAAVQSRAEGR